MLFDKKNYFHNYPIFITHQFHLLDNFQYWYSVTETETELGE